MSSSGPVTVPIPEPGQRPVTRLNLRRSLRSWHTLFSGGMTVLALTMSALALVPLVSVLFMVVIRGHRHVAALGVLGAPPGRGDAWRGAG